MVVELLLLSRVRSLEIVVQVSGHCRRSIDLLAMISASTVEERLGMTG